MTTSIIIFVIVLGICVYKYVQFCIKASKRFPPQMVKDFNNRYKKGFYNVRPE